MKKAFRQPSSVPKVPASSSPTIQSPPPSGATTIAGRYCTTEAATAKEMSMPPAMSTTSRPTPKMMLTEVAFSRSKRLGRVRKVVVSRLKPTAIRRMTTTSQSSVRPIPSLGMDGFLDRVDVGLARHVAVDEAAVAHVQDAVGVEVDFGDLVRDEQDRHARLGQPVHDREDAGARADVDAHGRGVEKQELRLRCQPLREHDPLLVAARQGGHGMIGVAD